MRNPIEPRKRYWKQVFSVNLNMWFSNRESFMNHRTACDKRTGERKLIRSQTTGRMIAETYQAMDFGPF